MKIVFGSNNKGKLGEIKSIFKDYEILSLDDVNCNLDPVESGNTFYDNAFKKAREIYDYVGMPVIADDSGLCVTKLDMWPGVNTKRFISGSDMDRNLEIIKKVNEINCRDREAIVSCSLVYYDGMNIIEGKGEIKGNITKNPRGDNGFGFDSIFELSNRKTLAELSSAEKNKCSARYLASISLLNKLNKLK
jgi:XTP/dITP diphosphohydrolase